jgi:hypothetical protein
LLLVPQWVLVLELMLVCKWELLLVLL